jgi:hypothetical protein
MRRVHKPRMASHVQRSPRLTLKAGRNGGRKAGSRVRPLSGNAAALQIMVCAYRGRRSAISLFATACISFDKRRLR